MKRIISVLTVMMLSLLACADIICFANSGDIKVNISTADSIVGNNFYKDNMPEFSVDIENSTANTQTGEYTVKAVDSKGKTLWSLNDSISLTAGEKVNKKIRVPVEYYGVMTFRAEVKVNGSSVSESVPYTLSNHTSDMPNNKRFGVTTHLSRGRGTIEDAAPLMKNAGIGIMRGEDMAWSAFEQEKGVYKLTDAQENVLNTLDKNDIDYMFICDSSSTFYLPEGDLHYYPVSTSEGYAALQRYMKELMLAANGKIKYVEVWNEYHSPNMSGPYCNNAEINANLHKAIYNGAKEGDKNVNVVGIVEDDWGLYYNGDFSKLDSGLVGKILKEMNKVKCFDSVSIHPYPNPRSDCFEGNIKADRFVSDLKATLGKYGYSESTPIIFSELGWSDEFLHDDEKKAAYTIRAHAYTQAKGLAETVINYNLMDYGEIMEENLGEATFGLVKSYGSYTDVPYLGKPAYVAVAYYNGLMADNKFKGEIDTPVEDGYCYSYSDRLGRNILMLGTKTDVSWKRVYLDTGKESVILSDMYGNETYVSTVDGVVELEMNDEPQYIIGASDNPEFTDKVVSDLSYKVFQTGEQSVSISGYTEGRYTINVYAPGKTEADLSSAPNALNTDVLVYHGEGNANDDGSFKLDFNIDGPSGEYKVCICSVDVFGRTLKVDATFYFEGREREIPLVDTDFSEGFSDISEWGHTFPDGWSMTYFSDWGNGAPDRVGTTLDGENRVFKFRLLNDGRTEREVRYDLPDLPDGSTLKIRYRAMLHSETNEAFMANRFYDASGKDAWITCMNYNNAGDQHYKGITTSCGSLWGQNGGVTLVNADSFKLDEWYTVDGTYSISGTSNAKASYKIYDKDGNLVGSADNLNVSNSMVKPTQFAFYAANYGSDNEAYAYYDDLKISYSYSANNVRELRLEDFDGNKIIPTAAPDNDIRKIDVTFKEAPTAVSAELKAGDTPVLLTQSGSDNEYSFEFNDVLSGGTKYTFTLNFDGEVYTYEFTPVSVGKIIVSDFNLYKGDKALTSLEEVSVGDEITVKAKLINLTGRDESACLFYSVYSGGFLKEFNFDAGTIPQTTAGLNLQRSLVITDGTGSINKISAFLWESMDSMVPIKNEIDVVAK